MKKYIEELYLQMLEIHKSILQRIVDTGEMQESDILFMKLFKNEFQQIVKEK